MSNEGMELDSLVGLNDSASSSHSTCTVAARLKLIRETVGISQRELAKRAGVTNSGISMIELGQVSPSIHSLERILSVIPISLSDFFSFELASSIRITSAVNESDQLFTVEQGAHSAVNQLSSRFVAIPTKSSGGLGLSAGDICGLVQEGSAQLKSIGMVDALVAGDTFYIPARQLYQFVNSGTLPLKLFLCSLFVHSH